MNNFLFSFFTIPFPISSEQQPAYTNPPSLPSYHIILPTIEAVQVLPGFILDIFNSDNSEKFSFLPGTKDNLSNPSKSVYSGQVSNNATTYRCRARSFCDQADYISSTGSHCQNGGLCDEDSDSGVVWCDCPAEYSGSQCEIKYDDCVSVDTERKNRKTKKKTIFKNFHVFLFSV